jgi:hypothetical protein
MNWEGFRRRSHGLIEVLSRHLPGGTGKNCPRLDHSTFRVQDYRSLPEHHTTRLLKRSIFWNITSCSPLKVNQHFGTTYRFHHQGHNKQSKKTARKQVASRTLTCSSDTLVVFKRTIWRYNHRRSLDSDWLRAGRPRGRSSIPGKVKKFLFSTSSISALGSTQPPIEWVPGGSFPGVKRPGREADHSPPSSAEITPAYAFMA